MYQYKYCSNCGGDFVKKSETHYECPECNFELFLDPKPSASALLINKKGEFLLIKRSYDPGKDLWDIPGGFLEPGETSEEAMIREVREEIGVCVSSYEYFGSFSGNYSYKGVNHKTINQVYIATIPDDADIVLSGESTEYKFFAVSELSIEDIGMEDTKKAVAKFVAQTQRNA